MSLLSLFSRLLLLDNSLSSSGHHAKAVDRNSFLFLPPPALSSVQRVADSTSTQTDSLTVFSSLPSGGMRRVLVDVFTYLTGRATPPTPSSSCSPELSFLWTFVYPSISPSVPPDRLPPPPPQPARGRARRRRAVHHDVRSHPGTAERSPQSALQLPLPADAVGGPAAPVPTAAGRRRGEHVGVVIEAGRPGN